MLSVSVRFSAPLNNAVNVFGTTLHRGLDALCSQITQASAMIVQSLPPFSNPATLFVGAGSRKRKNRSISHPDSNKCPIAGPWRKHHLGFQADFGGKGSLRQQRAQVCRR
jgi:hypothetical protein